MRFRINNTMEGETNASGGLAAGARAAAVERAQISGSGGLAAGARAAVMELQRAIQSVPQGCGSGKHTGSWMFPERCGREMDVDSTLERFARVGPDPRHVVQAEASLLGLAVDRAVLLASLTLDRLGVHGGGAGGEAMSGAAALVGVCSAAMLLEERCDALAAQVERARADAEEAAAADVGPPAVLAATGVRVGCRNAGCQADGAGAGMCMGCGEMRAAVGAVARRTAELGMAGNDAEHPGRAPADCSEAALQYLRGHEERLRELIRLRGCWEHDRASAIAARDEACREAAQLVERLRAAEAAATARALQHHEQLEAERAAARESAAAAAAAHAAELERQAASAASAAAEHAAAAERRSAVHDAALRQAHADRTAAVDGLQKAQDELETARGVARAAQHAMVAERDDARMAAAAATGRAEAASAEATEALDAAASERARADAASAALSAAVKQAQAEATAAERLRAADAAAAEAALEATRLSSAEAVAAAAAERDAAVAEGLARAAALQQELDAAKEQALAAEKWLDRAAAERARLLATIAAIKGNDGAAAPSPTPPGSPMPARRHPLAAAAPPNSPGTIQRASRPGPSAAAGSPKVDRRERQAAIKRFLAARAATPA